MRTHGKQTWQKRCAISKPTTILLPSICTERCSRCPREEKLCMTGRSVRYLRSDRYMKNGHIHRSFCPPRHTIWPVLRSARLSHSYRLGKTSTELEGAFGHPFAAEEIEPAPGSMSLWLVSAHLLCPSKETMPLALIFYGHP